MPTGQCGRHTWACAQRHPRQSRTHRSSELTVMLAPADIRSACPLLRLGTRVMHQPTPHGVLRAVCTSWESIPNTILFTALCDGKPLPSSITQRAAFAMFRCVTWAATAKLGSRAMSSQTRVPTAATPRAGRPTATKPTGCWSGLAKPGPIKKQCVHTTRVAARVTLLTNTEIADVSFMGQNFLH